MASISNQELELLKAYLSSLFARRQKYLWIDSVGEATTWYFSTIGTEMPDGQKKPGMPQPTVPIFAYKPSIDDFIHKVEFTDLTVPGFLYTILPCIHGKTVCIVLSNLLATINKKLLDTLVIDEYSAELPSEDKSSTTIVHFTDKITMGFLIGQCDGVLCRVIGVDHSFELPITNPKVIKRGDVSFVEIPLSHPSDPSLSGKLRLPLLEGCSVISTSEFLKKVPGEYRLVIHAAFDMLALRAVPDFITDSIRVLSVQPSAIWFPNFK